MNKDVMTNEKETIIFLAAPSSALPVNVGAQSLPAPGSDRWRNRS
jgi:hypothetical protein